jgi:hypothetical protein
VTAVQCSLPHARTEEKQAVVAMCRRVIPCCTCSGVDPDMKRAWSSDAGDANTYSACGSLRSAAAWRPPQQATRQATVTLIRCRQPVLTGRISGATPGVPLLNSHSHTRSICVTPLLYDIRKAHGALRVWRRHACASLWSAAARATGCRSLSERADNSRPHGDREPSALRCDQHLEAYRPSHGDDFQAPERASEQRRVHEGPTMHTSRSNRKRCMHMISWCTSLTQYVVAAGAGDCKSTEEDACS